MTKHRAFNVAMAVVYVVAAIVIALDLLVWRPG
jgi:hypothetical protein